LRFDLRFDAWLLALARQRNRMPCLGATHAFAGQHRHRIAGQIAGRIAGQNESGHGSLRGITIKVLILATTLFHVISVSFGLPFILRNKKSREKRFYMIM
jgi:hypothetical protein